jgi:capsular polysaccharide transport system permease protein
MLHAVLYYTFIAADRYVSQSIIAVKQSGTPGAAETSGFAALLGVSTGSREETLYVQEYVHSLDMLQHLDVKLGLRKAYEAEELDFIFRLYPGTSREWFHQYYQNRVELYYDDLTALLKIRVQGFNPAFAQAVSAEILAQSEIFVNELSHRLAREQMAFAESELRKARERYQAATSRLTDFQNRNKVLDPLAQAQSAAALTAQIENEIAHKEAELKTLTSYLQDDAPQVVMIRNQIAALKAQMEKERGKVASAEGNRLNSLAAEFQNLTLEAGFAEDAYKAALAAAETTRIEASRKIKNLVVIETPAIAETAEYPQRLYNLATLLIVLLLVYGIVRLAIATVRDHRD